jgi:hypothetical protein
LTWTSRIITHYTYVVAFPIQMIKMSHAGKTCMMRFVISIFAFEFKTFKVLTLATYTSATATHARSYRARLHKNHLT